MSETVVRMRPRPLYALHCSASTGGQWRALAAELGTERRVVTPDLPGNGTAPALPPSAVPALAHDAEPVIAALERERRGAHLVGHSFGGAVALHIALARPELVASLALYEPVIFPLLARSGRSDDTAEWNRIRGVAAAIARGNRFGRPEDGMAVFMDFWNGPGTWAGFDETQRRRLAGHAPRIQADFEAGFAEPFGAAEMARLEVPTLVMMGLDSPLAAQRVAELTAMALPRAQLMLLPEAAHMAPITDPAAVNLRIRRHIAMAERGGHVPFAPVRRAA